MINPKNDNGLGREYIGIRDEGYEIVMKIGDKVQNFPYFENESDPEVANDLNEYNFVKSMLVLQEQWNRRQSISNNMIGMEVSVVEKDELVEFENAREKMIWSWYTRVLVNSFLIGCAAKMKELILKETELII
jgi:hypothetical protein